MNAVNGERFQLINSAQLCKTYGEWGISSLYLYLYLYLCLYLSDPAAGASDDYFASLGGRFVYTPELREGPVSVFILPEEEILPSGQEFWAAWESMLDFLLQEAGRK